MKNIYNLMETHNLPGLSIGIIDEKGDLSVTAYGMRDDSKDVQVTASDIWHIGSCSKSMTSTLVAIFIEEGKISWDDLVSKFFPEINIHEKFKNINLRELLAHQSGIGPVSSELFKKLSDPLLDPMSARSMVVEESLGSAPEYPQGEENYANPNYIIAGAILEKLVSIPFEKLMKEKLFDPLGMDSAGFGPPGSEDDLDAPRGHHLVDGKLKSVYADNPPAFSPAGRVHCSLRDWGRYAFVHLKGEDCQILKSSSFDDLHKVFATSDYTPGGWVVMNEKWSKGPVLWHNGSNTLFMAHIWIAPKLEKAFLIVTNVAGEDAEFALVEVLQEIIKEKD